MMLGFMQIAAHYPMEVLHSRRSPDLRCGYYFCLQYLNDFA